MIAASFGCANCATFLSDKVAFDTEYSKNLHKMQCNFMEFRCNKLNV